MLPSVEGGRTPRVDFSLDIAAAIPFAVEYDPVAAAAQGEETTRRMYGHLPDDAITWGEYHRLPNEVVTVESAEYAYLLVQATQAAYQANTGRRLTERTIFRLPVTQRTLHHELRHGLITSKFGNSDTTVYYGVAFVYNEHGKLGAIPFVTDSGPTRKIHEAWSAIAPEDRSIEDVAAVAGMGYDPEDVYGIRRQAWETPGVPEGWARQESGLFVAAEAAGSITLSHAA